MNKSVDEQNKLFDRQGNLVDYEIASGVWVDELNLELCEMGVYSGCETCRCSDNPTRHTVLGKN
mgnify:CR=1 FL=1